MAVDSSNAVSQSQIISSTSKTTNTKKSNTLNMENFLSLLVAEMQNQDPLEPIQIIWLRWQHSHR